MKAQVRRLLAAIPREWEWVEHTAVHLPSYVTDVLAVDGADRRSRDFPTVFDVLLPSGIIIRRSPWAWSKFRILGDTRDEQ